jgi:hypothetical protein
MKPCNSSHDMFDRSRHEFLVHEPMYAVNLFYLLLVAGYVCGPIYTTGWHGKEWRVRSIGLQQRMKLHAHALPDGASG